MSDRFLLYGFPDDACSCILETQLQWCEKLSKPWKLAHQQTCLVHALCKKLVRAHPVFLVVQSSNASFWLMILCW
jgi:hypothetical protein